MRLLYDFIIVCASVFLLPYGFLKGISHGLTVRGTLERFAHYPRATKWQLLESKVILIHAVSVGEVLAAAPLIGKLKEQHPQRFYRPFNYDVYWPTSCSEIEGIVLPAPLRVNLLFGFVQHSRMSLVR